MKRSIDLTDDSIFSSRPVSFRNDNVIPRVPWNKKSKLFNRKKHRLEKRPETIVRYYLTEDLDDLDNDEIRADFQSYTTTLTTFNQINRNNSLIWDNTISESDWISLNQTSSSTAFDVVESEFFDTMDGTSYEYRITIPNKIRPSDIGKIISRDEFPTGKKKEIANKRQMRNLIDQTTKPQCYYCYSFVKQKPWQKKTICRSCLDKGLGRDRTKLINIHDGWLTRSQRTRSIYLKERSYLIPWREYYDQTESMHDKIQKEMNDIAWRYNAMIVVKRRGMNDDRRGANPWQPNGRIPQDYDEFFDNLSWKDVLDNWLKTGKSLLQE